MNSTVSAVRIHGTNGGKGRNSNEASASVARKLWLVAELLLRGRVSLGTYEALHRQGYRTFQRDLQQLRSVLRTHGFEISAIKQQQYVELTRNGSGTKPKFAAGDGASRLIAAIAVALGEPIRAALSVAGEEADPFYTFAMPRLVDGTRIAELCKFFREAAFSSGGRAIVAFDYRGANRNERTRRAVEPYRMLVRSGIFYLLAYDRGQRGWRYFALDRIEGKPRRDGTASADRTIPVQYASPDAVGFIKGDRAAHRVTVKLSPRVAASATARRWQKGQEVKLLLDGSAEISFVVTDEAEVIRWALGFGNDAEIIAPESAKRSAVALTQEIAARYASAQSAPTRRRSRP